MLAPWINNQVICEVTRSLAKNLPLEIHWNKTKGKEKSTHKLLAYLLISLTWTILDGGWSIKMIVLLFRTMYSSCCILSYKMYMTRFMHPFLCAIHDHIFPSFFRKICPQIWLTFNKGDQISSKIEVWSHITLTLQASLIGIILADQFCYVEGTAPFGSPFSWCIPQSWFKHIDIRKVSTCEIIIEESYPKFSFVRFWLVCCMWRCFFDEYETRDILVFYPCPPLVCSFFFCVSNFPKICMVRLIKKVHYICVN